MSRRSSWRRLTLWPARGIVVGCRTHPGAPEWSFARAVARAWGSQRSTTKSRSALRNLVVTGSPLQLGTCRKSAGSRYEIS
jgi:hypothetical protein